MNKFLKLLARYPSLSYLALTFAVMCLIFTIADRSFLSPGNLSNIIVASTTLVLLALGSLFVISSGGIDLSCGAMMALSALGGVALAQSYDLHWTLCIAASLVIGLSGGFANGVLISLFRLPAFIVTLGTMSIFRGLALIIGEGKAIYGLDKKLVFIGQGTIGPVPVPTIVLFVVIIAASLLVHFTRFGLYAKAIGNNETAVYRTGIQVHWHKVMLYMTAGFLSALAGIIFMARVNAADPNAGFMSELSAITAAVIGGVALTGGFGSVFGAVLGALTIAALQNGLTLLDIPSYYQQLIIGSALIITVILNKRSHHVA